MPTLTLPATTRRVASLLLVVASLLLTSPALAQSDDVPVPATLRVAAQRDCTSRADLIARVHARSPRVLFVAEAVEAGTVAIAAEFSTTPSGAVVGELSLAQSGAKPAARRLTARTCVEAADAAALIIAVTLDPTSAVRASQGSGNGSGDGAMGGKTNEGAERNVTAAVEKAAPAITPGKQPAESGPSPRGATPLEQPSSHPASPGASSPYELHLGVELAAEVLFGPAPRAMLGFGLRGIAAADGPPWWSPAALFGISQTWRSGVDESGGTASFALTAASLDACPFRLRIGRADARPCASLLGGRLLSQGRDTANAPDDRRRPFWVVGGAVLVHVPIVWRLDASARAALGGNLVRDSFAFGPDVFHDVPPVTVAASVGVGLRLP